MYHILDVVEHYQQEIREDPVARVPAEETFRTFNSRRIELKYLDDKFDHEMICRRGEFTCQTCIR